MSEMKNPVLLVFIPHCPCIKTLQPVAASAQTRVASSANICFRKVSEVFGSIKDSTERGVSFNCCLMRSWCNVSCCWCHCLCMWQCFFLQSHWCKISFGSSFYTATRLYLLGPRLKTLYGMSGADLTFSSWPPFHYSIQYSALLFKFWFKCQFKLMLLKIPASILLVFEVSKKNINSDTWIHTKTQVLCHLLHKQTMLIGEHVPPEEHHVDPGMMGHLASCTILLFAFHCSFVFFISNHHYCFPTWQSDVYFMIILYYYIICMHMYIILSYAYVPM